jgi:hypothetical protein
MLRRTCSCAGWRNSTFWIRVASRVSLPEHTGVPETFVQSRLGRTRQSVLGTESRARR